MSGTLGAGSSFFKGIQTPSGPPFVAGSAENGLSVDPVGGEIVLGNDVAAALATLMSNREIPMATFFIRLLLSATSSLTFQPDAATQLIQALIGNAAKTQGINIEDVNGAAKTTTFFRGRNQHSTGFSQIQLLNDLLNGLTMQMIGSTAAGANTFLFTVTGAEARYNVPTAAAFHRWQTQNTNRMSLLANGNLRVAGNNTDNTGKIQCDGTISGDRVVSARNITPVAINLNQNRDFFFTNEGAGALIVFNLPAAAAPATGTGYQYAFYVQDVNGIQVTAAAGDTIRIAGSVSSAGGTATSTTVGSCLKIVCINATEWVCESLVGPWTLA